MKIYSVLDGINTVARLQGPMGNQQPGCQGCSQEEKVVVFVGCTANGKSSLIRSILEYAGQNLEADSVEVGIGNKSTTKTVSSYKTTVQIKDHCLKNADGYIVDVNENTGVYELEPATSRSDRHVHLLMLDTPGLDDSDNLKDEEARNEIASNERGLQMRTADEMHKFAVLEALAGARKIHSVCFALSIESTLGDATQRVLKEYLAMFGKCKLDQQYHFAHTYVNIENMFGSKASDRPRLIEETFGIKEGTTKHYLINNLPLHDDPISKHFADLALSNLLDSLFGLIGQPTGHVCCPKSDAHGSMDEDLSQSVEMLERFQKAQVAALTENIRQFEASKRPLDLRHDVELKNWGELYTRFQELNTEELVKIGYQFKEEQAHLFSRTRLHFSLTAKAPIRDYKLFDTNSCVWSGLQNVKKGVDKHCSATLEAAWGDSASGSITLLGWKKEALAIEVSRAEKEQSEAWSDLYKTKEQIEALELQTEDARRDIALLTKTLKALNRVRDAIRIDHISLDDIRTHSRYLVVPNLCCYTVNHKESIYPQSLLYTNISSSDISEDYDQKVAETSKTIDVCTATLKALELDLWRKEFLSEQLSAARTAIMEHIVANEAKNADYPRWQPKSHLEGLSPSARAEVRKPLGTLQTELNLRLDHADDFILAGLNAENEALKRQAEDLQHGIEKMTLLIDANEHTRTKWTARLSEHELSLQAARDMVALSATELLPLGQFTLLRKAIDEYGPDSKMPWERLFQSWMEVLKCGRA